MGFLLLALLLLSPHVYSSSVDRSVYIIHMDKSFMPNVFASQHHWYSLIVDSVKSTDQISSSGGKNRKPEMIYSYDHAFHGFSAMLSKDELENLKSSPGFVSAHSNRKATLDTTHSTEFLNLSPVSGVWPLSEYGKDIIIGVVDGGIWPEHPSFGDDGMSKTNPAKWKGICQEGQDFNTSLCNSKLIGAQYFNRAAVAANPDENITMNSARDTSGHGSHVAGIAAGNYVKDVSFFGYGRGTARGAAPRAKLAVYKVTGWNSGDLEAEADALAGIDKAVADGVDVISMSLNFGGRRPLLGDPIVTAAFGAMEKGVFFSSSAGSSALEEGGGGFDLQWNYGLEPKRKWPKEQDFLETNNNNNNNSQISSLDFLQAQSVSTGLGLSLDNGRLASSGDSAFLGLAGDDIERELRRQEVEMDRYMKAQGGRMRQAVLEKLQASQLQLMSSIEDKVIQKLREKEAEMEHISKKNMELESRLEQLASEANAWQHQAKYNENMINTLKLSLQQVYAQTRDSKEGCGDSEVDDTASCCHGRPLDFTLLSNGNNEIKESMICKVCRVNQASMLLLPCKHLCLCKECENKVNLCPVCQSSKYIGMEVFM